MEQIKVIVVDDDTDLGNLINMALTADGYNVHFQNSLAGIKSIIEEFKPSILVLDVEIGKDDGITGAKDIFLDYPSMPVLFISSHTDIESITRGVSTGAVGYIRKPFDMQELKVYIERFANPKNQYQGINIGNYALNTDTRELFHSGKQVKQLSPLEFKALLLFSQNKNKIIRYEKLSEHLWSKPYATAEASINNLILKLRKLLENDPNVCIQTVKNVGYKLICNLLT